MNTLSATAQAAFTSYCFYEYLINEARFKGARENRSDMALLNSKIQDLAIEQSRAENILLRDGYTIRQFPNPAYGNNTFVLFCGGTAVGIYPTKK
ncbi:MAG: hypothetical protein LBB14_01555 [Puniceicoccales bacterium]|jgi:hypothetical protein|nr:hypothetical protein [Puniceicoccales bacterium]